MQKKIIKYSNKPVPEELGETEETMRKDNEDIREETEEDLLVRPSTSGKKLASAKNHLTVSVTEFDRDSDNDSGKSLQGSHQFGKGSKFSNTKESLEKKKKRRQL